MKFAMSAVLLAGLASAGACTNSLKKATTEPAGSGQGGQNGEDGRGGAFDDKASASGPLLLDTSEGPLRVTVLETGTIRLTFQKNSHAKVLVSFAVDPAYVPSLPAYSVEELDGATKIATEAMSVVVKKDPLIVTQFDAGGREVLRVGGAKIWGDFGPALSFSLDEGERVFGLGDKAKGHDRRGKTFEMWNTDAFGWKVDQDPLYKSFPVFMFMDGGESHGVFIDSPTRAQVDVGAAHPNEMKYNIAQGESVDVYLFAGTEPKRVLERYTQLTGRTPLPPYWSLGFHMSRYGYLSEQEVRDVVARFHSGGIPLDVIWLDIDFQNGNAPFTVNSVAFPHFRGMIEDFQNNGVKTVCITDLHVKSYQGGPTPSGYLPYDSGAAGDHFLQGSGGARFYEGEVWPGASVFPEFTLARTRTWWGQLYESFLNDGVAGFWNDMNEPAVFNVTSKTIPETQLHRFDDGSTQEHQVIHNAFGALNVRATFEGVQKLRPEVRPFTLTRAAYAGAQRYSASWTGDNTADRAHLAATIPNLTNLGVSGYGFIGADVGGFDGCPDKQLLAEWMELGAFQPFYRNHSGKGTCMREPWVHGEEIETRTRKAIERRYQFLPYIYTVFEEAARTGVPMMRPLWLEYPEDQAVAVSADAFFVGSDVLVAPQLAASVRSYSTRLPQTGFYDRKTGALHAFGGLVELQTVPEDSIRLFVRQGAILPLAPPVQHSGQSPGKLILEIYPGDDCRGQLYVDDGKSLNYRKGALRRVTFSCTASSKGIEIVAQSSGTFPAWWKEVELVVYGVASAPGSFFVDGGKEVPAAYDVVSRRAQAKFANEGASFRATATW